MLSRSLLRSSLRALPRTSPRLLPRAPITPLSRPSASSNFRRYNSGWGQPPPPPPRRPTRVVHYRYNPEEVQRAKPLLTTDQVFSAARSPTTKWIIVVASGSAAIFYISNLEEVPVSGRRRFNCYSDATVEAEGRRMYDMIMQENHNAILPA